MTPALGCAVWAGSAGRGRTRHAIVFTATGCGVARDGWRRTGRRAAARKPTDMDQALENGAGWEGARGTSGPARSRLKRCARKRCHATFGEVISCGCGDRKRCAQCLRGQGGHVDETARNVLPAAHAAARTAAHAAKFDFSIRSRLPKNNVRLFHTFTLPASYGKVELAEFPQVD